MNTPDIRLNDNTSIPQIGLGVFQALDGQEISATRHALSVGYRHIDTAAIYHNETGVGRAMRESGVARSSIFLTSKVWNDEMRAGNTTAAIDKSLQRLKTEYLDLMLLHWPVEGRIEGWRALIEARKAGKVRSIGVSNFLPEHLDELNDCTGVVPAINQIEFHPWLRQPAIKDACDRLGIVVEAWAPLMRGNFESEPLFAEIAAEHGKTQAQVVLRWALQHGIVIIPKSVNPSRIEENFNILDFELSTTAMQRIDALDRNQRIGPDPHNFDF